MTAWRCTFCHTAATFGRLYSTVSPDYRHGYCWKCLHERTFTLGSEPLTGAHLAQRGMAITETAEAMAGDWTLRADAAIRDLASHEAPFSAEDVARLAGRPSHPNAMGARINAAARRGIIVKAGSVLATRRERHANEMRLWRGAA